MIRNSLLVLLTLASVDGTVKAAETQKRDSLYDIVADLDGDGRQDRAVLVLVGPGRDDFGELTKERYGLKEEERTDLYIYLGNGDAALDLSRPPDVLKEAINAMQWVMPLETSGKGALRMISANGYGSSNQVIETLTIVQRRGEWLVGGYTLDWEMRESIGKCDLNLLTGKGYRQDGLDGAPIKPLKGRFKTVSLADWSDATRPTVCDGF